jgi:uncharacterized membrane protein
MANKNRNVIIAYFPSAAAAEGASESLRMWDKADDDIKLGGIGILTAENGEIKVNNVGAKASGTGAKAGAVIGIVAGVLSGGVTLIGGALAGLVGGSVLGSLKHKNLGLEDGDIDTLKAELTNGKAALVVTADDDEVYPTKTKIEELGGTVMHYTADREASEAITLAAVESERFLRQSGVGPGGIPLGPV